MRLIPRNTFNKKFDVVREYKNKGNAIDNHPRVNG